MLFMLLVYCCSIFIIFKYMTCLILLKYEFMVFWSFFLTILWGKSVYHSSDFEFAVSQSVLHFMIFVADMKLSMWKKIKIKVISLMWFDLLSSLLCRAFNRFLNYMSSVYFLLYNIYIIQKTQLNMTWPFCVNVFKLLFQIISQDPFYSLQSSYMNNKEKHNITSF